MINFIRLTLALLLLFIFSACSSKSDFIKQDTLQSQGNYKEAISHAKTFIDHNDSTARDNLLWELYLGQSYYFDNNHSASIAVFDEAERLMKYHRDRLLAVDVTKDFAAILSNDTTRPYIGTEYDGIMLNTYKALAYLKSENFNASRVEFNRVIDRQRRAKEFFQEAIEKEREAMAQKSQEEGQSPPSQQQENSQMQSVINQSYPELNTYRIYPEYVNPASNYLAALFALANDDTAKARYLFKEAAMMLPENKTLQEDYARIEAGEDEPSVWLIYEEGLGPVLNEFRIDFPAWIFTSQVNIVSIAVPRLQERTGAFEYLELRDANTTLAQTELLSSMEGVVKTEFKLKFPGIMKRAAISAISKALMQKAANDSNNNFIAFATTLYTIFSTQADTRIWSTLPKNFHVARIKKGMLKSVDIYMPQGFKIATVKLLDTKHSLIYVKIPTLAHKAHVDILPLGGY